jgi:hypothetical protein
MAKIISFADKKALMVRPDETGELKLIQRKLSQEELGKKVLGKIIGDFEKSHGLSPGKLSGLRRMTELKKSNAEANADDVSEEGRVLINTGSGGWRYWGKGTRESVRSLNLNAVTDEGKGTTYRWEPFTQNTEH